MKEENGKIKLRADETMPGTQVVLRLEGRSSWQAQERLRKKGCRQSRLPSQGRWSSELISSNATALVRKN
jgi:hypothetical protein